MEGNAIEKVIINYLQKPTSYALCITGPWGSGKSYFLKNEIFPKIKSIKASGNDQFEPVMVSLYEIADVNDLKEQVFYKCIGVNSNFGKATAGAIKTFLGTSEELVKSATELVTSSKIRSRVVCFDDLERMDSQLLRSVIGYINDLSENKGVKCIILANEQEIIDKPQFEIFKEKTIGLIVNYLPNIPDILASIIGDLEEGPFKSFLVVNISYMADVMIKAKYFNFRSINYFISHFTDIFNTISLSNFTYEESKVIALLEAFKFTLGVTIEFREGVVTASDKKGLDRRDAASLMLKDLHASDEIKEKNKTIKNIFIAKYDINHYFFFSSIYNYLVGKSELDQNSLMIEIKELFDRSPSGSHDSIHLLSHFRLSRYTQLSNISFREVATKVLAALEDGVYGFKDSVDAFLILKRFSRILEISEKELAIKAKEGLDNAYEKAKYISYFENSFELQQQDEFVAEVYEHAKNLNIKKGKDEEEQEGVSFKQLLFLDINLWFLKLNDQYSQEPILKYLSQDEVYLYLTNLENRYLYELKIVFKNRYSNYPRLLKDEEEFLVKLNKYLTKKEKSKTVEISDLLIEEIQFYVNEDIEKLKDIKD